MLESLPSAAFDDAIALDAGAAAVAILPTDGERLMRFQRYRDEGAFAQVVETHAKMVWGVCSQILRHQQDVEDAFQATFLILARKAGSIRASDSAAGWIYRVAYRTALLAHSRRCRRSESQLSVDLPSLDDQLSEIERNEVALRLLEELNALPLRYRQPLVLCHMEGHSRSEAAEQMGVSTQTVKGLLARGTRLLRSRLIRRGVALSASMAVVNSAMSSAHAAAAPSLVSSTASLGMSFALKLKVTASGIKGASLKSVAACALAEKGIIAMTIAAASKPAVGILGVCLAVGMLAVADAEPSKRLALAGGEGNVMLISTEAAADAVAEEDEEEVAATTDVLADIAIEEEEIEVENGDVYVAVEDAAPQAGSQDDLNAPLPPPVPTAPAADIVAAVAPAVPGAPAAPAAMAISVAGAPPVDVVEDVFVQAGAPLPVPAAQPVPGNFELARKFEFQYQNNPFAGPVHMTTSAPASASSGSEAALKLEGEYWDLKAAGLKKKADAIQLKVDSANAQLQVGKSELNEGEILDLSAEKDLTLAEVKLCEMNAQRVRDALEERAKAKDGEKQVQMKMKQAIINVADVQKAAVVHAKQAAMDAVEAQRVAAKAQQAAAEHAQRAVKEAAEARGEAGKAVVKALSIRKQTPAAANAPVKLREIYIDDAPDHVDAELATLPKGELKKLLSLVESTKELEKRLKELEEEKKKLQATLGQEKEELKEEKEELKEEGKLREY